MRKKSPNEQNKSPRGVDNRAQKGFFGMIREGTTDGTAKTLAPSNGEDEMMDFSWVKKGVKVELMHYSGKLYHGTVECEPFPVGKQGYLRTRLCDMDPEYVVDFGCHVHPLADLRCIRPEPEQEESNVE
jgi:hypothetical protein